MQKSRCRFNIITKTPCCESSLDDCVPLKECLKSTSNHLHSRKALPPGSPKIPEWKLILGRSFIFDYEWPDVHICTQHRDNLGNIISINHNHIATLYTNKSDTIIHVIIQLLSIYVMSLCEPFSNPTYIYINFI